MVKKASDVTLGCSTGKNKTGFDGRDLIELYEGLFKNINHYLSQWRDRKMIADKMDECQQKYQKVYSYLKRNLPQERYEGIRVIDRCVIVADGFNKSFMFAVLGDNMLYITENPPKLPRDIRITLDLSTVTSVEMVSKVYIQVSSVQNLSSLNL